MRFLNFLKGVRPVAFEASADGLRGSVFDPMWGALSIILGATALAASWQLFKQTG